MPTQPVTVESYTRANRYLVEPILMQFVTSPRRFHFAIAFSAGTVVSGRLRLCTKKSKSFDNTRYSRYRDESFCLRHRLHARNCGSANRRRRGWSRPPFPVPSEVASDPRSRTHSYKAYHMGAKRHASNRGLLGSAREDGNCRDMLHATTVQLNDECRILKTSTDVAHLKLCG